jgi:hypothetical protein
VGLHQDVRGSIAPARLQPKSEASVGPLFEAIDPERRPRHVVAQPLEPAPIAGGHGDLGVEAHAVLRGSAARSVGIVVAVLRLDAIAQAPPTLAGVATGRDAGEQRCAGKRREQGLVAGERVGVALGARREQSRDPRRARQHPGDLVMARRWQGKEVRRPLPGPGVDAVESERVEVEVEVQGGAEALDEGDGAALAARSAPVLPRAPAELGEECADEGAQHGAREPRVVGAAIAKRIGKREHPLADRHSGEDAVHEARRGVGHAPPTAGGTEAAALARERNEPVEPAVVAVHAQEAEGQHTAAEVVPELLLDEAGHGLVPPARLGQKGLELPPDDAVEDALLGAVARVRRLRRAQRSAVRMGRGGRGLRQQPSRRLRASCPARMPRRRPARARERPAGRSEAVRSPSGRGRPSTGLPVDGHPAKGAR